MSDTSSSQPESDVPSRKYRARAVCCLLVLYWLTMFAGTHWPKPNFPHFDSPLQVDKILHFCGYFGLTVLLFSSLYLNRRSVSLMRLALGVGLLIAGYGVIDEMTQPLFSRYADWTDWIADLAGCATGLLCALLWFRGTRSSAAATP